ncbi:MAG: tRNA (guanosine(37)-N1)-methyltransferase TrmD [Gammaproteobacteria bacterium]|nr:tRNA (guanosine(37)-N1)-methyltransferase TrmD [Gammaproteobacteria bacterium]MCI0590210.1 tRNA (guanosine(37)-N1)-methyltransferase TrmD [Gammaproteobacteria bacterium]
MFDAITGFSITGRAIERGLLELTIWDPRDFAKDRHHTVDDRPYGGGPGMVMKVQPVRDAIRSAVRSLDGDCRVIYLTPQGRRLDQAGVSELARVNQLVLLSGRYEGVDERIIQTEIDEEWSIGDYVLTGGEIAAMVVIDALTRTVPHALGHEHSACDDSFFNGLLEYPHFTRPEEIDGLRIPAILLSGDHQAIERWRRKQALGRTWMKRPDLIKTLALDEEQQALLEEFIFEQQEQGDH